MVETFHGTLFTSDFLTGSIAVLPDFTALDAAAIEALRQQLAAIFASFPTAQTPNETQTEDDLIWPVLNALGWTSHLRQQNLAARGRDDVRYIYSTFPIVEEQETSAHGRYLSRDLCLAYIAALAAGDPDAEVHP